MNTTPTENKSPDSLKVPLKTKVAWGTGGLADNYMLNVPNALALPIYNISFGVSAVLMGLALAIPRIIDAFFDAMVGNWSDNTRSRWGRRKPWMIAGTVLCAIILPLLWMPPFEGVNGRFIYFLVLSLIYFLSYSLFVVPYTALGFELTTDYNEKTRALAWRMYIGLIGSFTYPWIYKLCFLPIFQGSEVVGARWICTGVGIVILITGLIPVFFCQENPQAMEQKEVPLKEALRDAFKNKSFQIVLIGYVLILLGLFSSGVLGLYVLIHSVCNENKEMAAEISGWCGSSMALAAYLSLPLATWVSAKIGKKEAMILCLGIALAGVLCMILVLKPYVPYWTIPFLGKTFQIPYLQMLPSVVFGIGMQGAWLMVSTMTADVCDEDEIQTGLRQEGIYGAVTSFAQKAALGIAAILGGLLLKLAGYTEGAATTPEIAENLKMLYIGGQGLGLALGMVLFSKYSISKKRALEIRAILDQRAKK